MEIQNFKQLIEFMTIYFEELTDQEYNTIVSECIGLYTYKPKTLEQGLTEMEYFYKEWKQTTINQRPLFN